MDHLEYIPGLLKVPEFVLAFIIMVMTRAGGDGGYFPWGKTVDSLVLGDLVSFGFFVFILVQLIGFIGGEKAPLQSGVGALIMSLCYLAAGGAHLDLYGGLYNGKTIDTPIGIIKIIIKDSIVDTALAMGSLAIIQGLILMADAGISFMTFLKSRN